MEVYFYNSTKEKLNSFLEDKKAYVKSGIFVILKSELFDEVFLENINITNTYNVVAQYDYDTYMDLYDKQRYKIKHYLSVILAHRNVKFKRYDIMSSKDYSELSIANYKIINSVNVHMYKDLSKYYNSMINLINKGDYHYIVILPEEIYTYFKSKTTTATEHFTIFNEKGLMFDITSSIYVPQHKVCLTMFQQDKLPILKFDDPIRKWYGFKSGSVIEISRTLSNETYYRRVE
jgi:DNA-directed RNA polymerase subunit H (RpoH/RPB5)